MAEIGQPSASRIYSYSKPNDTNTGKEGGRAFQRGVRYVSAVAVWYVCIVLASTK